MPKFSEVAAGSRARRKIFLPLPGAQLDPDSGEWSGPTSPLEIRALREDEHDEVLAQALAFCKKKGLEHPEDGDALYERAKMLHTLAIACVDVDSPKEAPAPYFDGGWEQIQKSEVMTPEVIGYLYLQQQMMQDDVNPLRQSIKPGEFIAAAISTAKGNMAFFVNSRPAVQWSFLRTLASLHIASLASSSQSSQPSAPPPTTTG